MSEEQRSRMLAGGGRDARSEAGFGIGLSYVNKMLEVHYGEGFGLSIESRPGSGTVYSFSIPLLKEAS